MSIAKFGKKLGCLLIALFMVFAFIGCEVQEQDSPEKTLAKEHNAAVYEKLYWDASAMKDITSDIELITKTLHDDTTVRWASSHPDIISTTGAVTRPVYNHEDATLVNPKDPENTSKHVEVKLTASIKTTYGEEQQSIVEEKEFKFTVLCLDENLDFGTIAEVKARAYQYIYEEQGVQKDLVSNSSVIYSVGFYGKVTAILNADGAGQFMVHDGTEGIYVYSKVDGLKLGDTVLVYGNVYSYYGSLQVGSNVTATIVEDRGIEVGEYTKISVETWEHNYEIGYLGGKLYSIYAKLETGSNSPASDKYKLVDPFTGETAWIYYKSYNAEQEEVLKQFVGEYVNITGVSYDRDSRCVKNHLLWDGGIEKAEAPELTDAQKIANVKATLALLAGDYASGAKLELPVANEEYGATISWELPANAPFANGKFSVVTEKTQFVAKATITINETTEELEVTFNVKPVEELSIADACKKEKDSVVKITGTVETIFGSKGNFYLKDATGTILVYVATKDGITVNGVTVTLKAGDKVTLTGTTNVFNGTPQIGSIISYDAHEAGEWEISAPVETSFEEMKAYTAETAPYGKYLMLRGKVVSDGNFYAFTNGEVTISLYNSNVPEALQAIKDTDTEATLFFYYYGNSKADYTGAIRVVFSGRPGEFFIGDEEVVIPEGRKDVKTDFEVKSFDELVALVPNENDTTTEKHYVAGYVKEIVNTTYGNLYIETASGDQQLYVYGLYSFNGKVRFDAMENAPKVGQAVVLYGVMSNYKGTAQMKNAWMVQLDETVFKEEVIIPDDGETVLTLNMGSIASANSWTDATQYTTLPTGDESISIAAAPFGTNSGKYYVNGLQWRLYQSEGTALVIAGLNGATIVSVKVAYVSQNNGTLVNNGTNVATDTLVSVNASTISLSVGNTGDKTNGQARITEIVVVYKAAK